MSQRTVTSPMPPSDPCYNAPDELPDADDIEKYDNIVGGTFMLYPNTGDNKNISTKATVKIIVLDTLGNPV